MYRFLILILFVACAGENHRYCQRYCGVVGVDHFKHKGFSEYECRCSDFKRE